ncbi:hypothetical protein BHM03_00050385 [Ensete ventricosum]|nr:hypothetical protein BHM03_00050385 [Ensete ventricosum]
MIFCYERGGGYRIHGWAPLSSDSLRGRFRDQEPYGGVPGASEAAFTAVTSRERGKKSPRTYVTVVAGGRGRAEASDEEGKLADEDAELVASHRGWLPYTDSKRVIGRHCGSHAARANRKKNMLVGPARVNLCTTVERR